MSNFFTANSRGRFCFFIIVFRFPFWLFICLCHNFVGFFFKRKKLSGQVFLYIYILGLALSITWGLRKFVSWLNLL